MEQVIVTALTVYPAVADATEKNGFDLSGELLPTPEIRKGSHLATTPLEPTAGIRRSPVILNG